MTDDDFRCGTLAIVGRPNVGKSTLLNALVGQKLSITSRKPQTTRHRVLGIVNRTDAQYVFVDTPGFQTLHGGVLNRALNAHARAASETCDVLLFLVEALKFDSRDQTVLKSLSERDQVIVGITKTDVVKDKASLLPHIQALAEIRPFAAIVPLSARRKASLNELLSAIRPLLPAQPAIFGVDDITDRSERFLAAEFVREKLFRLLGDEIPYSTHVLVQNFAIERGIRRISADIVVSRRGHKGMIVGKGGAMLKAIGTAARVDMEKCFGGKVFLELWVRERTDWENQPAALAEFGYLNDGDAPGP
jgi:GTPase